MTSKFDNLINSTFTSLIEETPSPEEVVQNPELQLAQQATTIKAAGGPKTPQEKELMKKADELAKNQGSKAGQTLDAVKDLEQAQKEVKS